MIAAFILHFDDGPAAEQVVETAILPSDVRWFLQLTYGENNKTTSWWIFHEEPKPDDDVQVTKYVKHTETLVDGESHVYYSMETK